MSVNSKMTAIADEIRELSGTTGAMGLDAMATNLGDANNEVDSQTALITQIANALEGKAVGGGGGGNTLAEELITGTISSYSNSSVTTIKNYAFCDCTKLVSLDLPAATSVGTYGIGRCTSLETVNLPAAVTFAANALDYCPKITELNLPSATSAYTNAFGRCHKLTKVNLPVMTYISANAFLTCRVLSSITLGAPSVCTLVASNAFNSTPFAGYSNYFSGTPYIYVPASLLTSYQAATNWTYFSSYFSTIESIEA